jgi:putative chitinase
VTNIEKESASSQHQIELEKYKAHLDYRKFIWGTVVAGTVIALIPPLFQFGTAGLEYVKSIIQLNIDKQNKDADRETTREQFRDQYIRDFLTTALNQDIELRIRFAEYFSYVAPNEEQKDWSAYRDELKKNRDVLRAKIDSMESDWQVKARESNPNSVIEADRIAGNLAWVYKEVGYVEKDRSVTLDPRSPRRDADSSSGGLSDVASLGSQVASDLTTHSLQPAKYVLAIDRTKFYSNLSTTGFGPFSDEQKKGFDTIVDYWNLKYSKSDARMLAYILGTAYFETAKSMQPSAETGYGKGSAYGIPNPTTGKVYYGRGIIGLTWAENYQKMGAILGIDLYNNPDLALDPAISAAIAVEGMMRGSFTNKKLGDFFDASKEDWINARRVVSMLDNAGIVANYATRMFTSLQYSTAGSSP